MKLTDTRFTGREKLVGSRLAVAVLLLLSLSHCAQFSTTDDPARQSETAQNSEPQPAQQPAAEQQPATEQARTPDVASGSDSLPVAARPVLAPELQQQFTQAKELLRQQDYQAALSLLEPLALALPDAPGIHYNLAVCYWQLQQTEQARVQLSAILARQPDYVEAANLLGVIARQAGDFNQARRYWLDALATRSDFAKAHKNLGFLYELYLAQPEQARYHYQQYQQLSSDPMAEAWLSLLEQQE
ncbi:tetratricopeptide repeat protein [Arsukibacterium sp.]|uniref:tetratricopeptide repeat protein n=1 Tax=Arsukibacterium sp. TaxID=1977258 RepID=UPI00299D5429|nr:tetratricopeptide repeat protein [Arsukibacterium sp.]MDX1538318.1 tetratricopeptide repeat protein [Arsukibacterium sp.]